MSHTVVAELLKREKFSLQANSKTCQGSDNPDRDAQVDVIDAAVKAALAEGQPVTDGIYDLAADAGWVSVGMNHDTSTFAVNTIRRWWIEVGRLRYDGARRLVITADGGGSDRSRVRLWTIGLQALATELGIDIELHHLMPGTRKWNQIEHKLFSFIGMNR